MLSTSVACPCLCELAWRPRINAYSWPNPSISGTAHAQWAEGLHFSAFHLRVSTIPYLKVLKQYLNKRYIQKCGIKPVPLDWFCSPDLTSTPPSLPSSLSPSIPPFSLSPSLPPPSLPPLSLPPSLQICSILYSYKECKPSLKREGWEQSAYLRMQREYSGQFEFESAGATSRQSKHKKRSMKEDKKRRTGREREREESEGGGRQGGMVEAPRPEEPRPSSLRRSPSPQEPGYQTISTATAATATARVHPSSGAQQAREHV